MIDDIDLDDLDIRFHFNNIAVESIFNEKNKSREIKISGNIEVNPMYSVFEAQRLIRPWLLCVQGIISLFLDYPVTVYQIAKTSDYLCDVDDNIQLEESTFRVGEIDYSKELDKVLEKIDDPKYRDLSISILDRWRKTLNLQEEDEISGLYIDEALLGLFHLLELLSNNYIAEFRKETNEKIESSVREYGSFIFKRGDKLDSFVNEKSKDVSLVLGSKEPDFTTKIKYLLYKNGLTSDNEMYFAESIVKLRNKIAHGRVAFQPVFEWPVSPFFNISRGFTQIELLELLVKKLIGNYFGISSWNADYQEIAREQLRPSTNKINDFLDNPNSFDYVTLQTLDTSIGNEGGITWYNIFLSYLENHKKITPNRLGSSLKKFFLDLTIDEEDFGDVFLISVILLESTDTTISNRCRENLDYLLTNKLLTNSDLRDLIPTFDFYKIEYNNYKKFLESKLNNSN